MNALVYRLTYWFGMANWDSDQIAPEVKQVFQAGDFPDGPVLDLGCGTGSNVIYMAAQGRPAIGIDFVPQAIAKARTKSKKAGLTDRTQFLVADVTRMADLHLPACGFALDMGCFHGLNVDGQGRYAQGLADVLLPGGRFLLYTLDPRREMGFSYGLTSEQVEMAFSPWFLIERTERGSFWNRNSTWFWMKKRARNRK